MPKTRKVTAAHASGIENLPVWNGPGVNFFWPQTTRAKIGTPQARLFPATAREKRADAAAKARYG